MNETTLRHLFQKQEDESFRGYVERMRMTKALQLLSGGKKTGALLILLLKEIQVYFGIL